MSFKMSFYIWRFKTWCCICIWSLWICKGELSPYYKIKYFADSCAAQYKNYKNFLNLCHHYSDFDLEAEWNFFATGHGKSAVDGMGETIKQLTATGSLQRPYNNQILSAEAVYQFCSKTIENISFNWKGYFEFTSKLARRYEHGGTIPGTHSYHQFCPASVNETDYKRMSDENDLAGIFTFSKAPNPKKVLKQFLPMSMLHVIMAVTGGWDWCRM